MKCFSINISDENMPMNKKMSDHCARVVAEFVQKYQVEHFFDKKGFNSVGYSIVVSPSVKLYLDDLVKNFNSDMHVVSFQNPAMMLSPYIKEFYKGEKSASFKICIYAGKKLNNGNGVYTNLTFFETLIERMKSMIWEKEEMMNELQNPERLTIILIKSESNSAMHITSKFRDANVSKREATTIFRNRIETSIIEDEKRFCWK
jgi:hypothetical protein